ncbi:MAG: GxxExxY protein [Planctomycetales bacterium]|nr:GxxExxY protein [Planctomycetales bacterium]
MTMEQEEITGRVIGCAIEVHRQLGPGLLESAYEKCLAFELRENGIQFQRQLPMPVEYKETRLECGYRIDFLIEEKLIVELKSAKQLIGLDEAQLLTYMKLAKVKLGLLMNFNETRLKSGIRRFIL